jgi:hypothetical protein
LLRNRPRRGLHPVTNAAQWRQNGHKTYGPFMKHRVQYEDKWKRKKVALPPLIPSKSIGGGGGGVTDIVMCNLIAHNAAFCRRGISGMKKPFRFIGVPAYIIAHSTKKRKASRKTTQKLFRGKTAVPDRTQREVIPDRTGAFAGYADSGVSPCNKLKHRSARGAQGAGRNFASQNCCSPMQPGLEGARSAPAGPERQRSPGKPGFFAVLGIALQSLGPQKNAPKKSSYFTLHSGSIARLPRRRYN